MIFLWVPSSPPMVLSQIVCFFSEFAWISQCVKLARFSPQVIKIVLDKMVYLWKSPRWLSQGFLAYPWWNWASYMFWASSKKWKIVNSTIQLFQKNPSKIHFGLLAIFYGLIQYYPCSLWSTSISPWLLLKWLDKGGQQDGRAWAGGKTWCMESRTLVLRWGLFENRTNHFVRIKRDNKMRIYVLIIKYYV